MKVGIAAPDSKKGARPSRGLFVGARGACCQTSRGQERPEAVPEAGTWSEAEGLLTPAVVELASDNQIRPAALRCGTLVAASLPSWCEWCAHLSIAAPLSTADQVGWENSFRWPNSVEGPRETRECTGPAGGSGSVAPHAARASARTGAKGSFLCRTCQITSARVRASSTRATFLPR